MSMHNYASSGYVVPVEQLVLLIAPEHRAELQKHIESQDWEEAQKLLSATMPSKYPTPESCFVLNDECETEDLTIGEMYAFFDESDLFVKRETKTMQALKSTGAVPTFARWVTWG